MRILFRRSRERPAAALIHKLRALQTEGAELLCDHRRLPRDVKPLAAAHVLAGHHVVLADHVGPELREPRPVPLIGTSPKLPFLGADNPSHFVLRRLVAVRTVQRGWFFLLLLVKKIALFHSFRAASLPQRRSLKNY